MANQSILTDDGDGKYKEGKEDFVDFIQTAKTQCIAYFKKTYIEALETTIPEYIELQKAYALYFEEKSYFTHLQAWANRSADAKKMVGKKEQYVYKNFKDFYNREEAIKRALYGNESVDRKEKTEKEGKATFNAILERRLQEKLARKNKSQ